MWLFKYFLLSNYDHLCVSSFLEQEFPWHPKPVNLLTGAVAGDINDFPAIIWFTKDTPAAEKAKSTLQPIAEQWIKDFKDEKVKEEVKFFYHSVEEDDDDIASSLKSFANIGDEVVVILIDIPNQEV